MLGFHMNLFMVPANTFKDIPVGEPISKTAHFISSFQGRNYIVLLLDFF